jgi:hypothetical protein
MRRLRIALPAPEHPRRAIVVIRIVRAAIRVVVARVVTLSGA